ncbi:MAG: YndJ family transporter [Myxococcaceae bacterium]|jgi:hypothetical protein|nr:YndJ family transporter [Myxococcaceae bacterium]
MTLPALTTVVVNGCLVAGVGVVLPLALRRPFTPFLAAALGVAASLAVAPGWPAALPLAPWVALSLREVAQALARRRLAPLFLGGFSLTAALALIAARLGWTLFGVREPLVTLTAVHFTYAGVGTLALAVRAVEQRPQASRRLAGLLLMGAPPFTAVGFLTGLALFQVGGAVAMSLGVLAVAVFNAREARRRARWSRRLLFGSAVAPWAAMALAVAWAANQHWPQVPALGVPDMVPTHGVLNAFGFVLAGHLAWWCDARGA